MYDWREDRYECIQFLIEQGYSWVRLNKMSDASLTESVYRTISFMELMEDLLSSI